MLSHINLINIMLAGVIIFFINYTLLPFLHKSIQYALPAITKHEEAVSVSDKKPDQAKTPSPLDYMIITEQNLFHPERKIPAEIKEAQPLPKPDFVLYGTLLSDDVNIAYMEDKKSPFSTPGRGTRPVALQIGQTLSGFTVKKIYHEKVIMARGEQDIEINVVDNKRVRASEAVSATPSSAKSPKSGSIREKPKGSGLPPGTIHTGPPPAGTPAPDEQTLSKVKGAFGPVIMKKLGNQQTEKPK